MGSSGSAWIKPKKREGLRPARLTNRPHPRFVRAGQRYFPLRRTTGKRQAIKIVRALPADQWAGKREDGRAVRVKAGPLLATDERGQGRYYRFVGYTHRRYDTHGVVVDVGATWTQLVLPEWHPSIVVNVGTGTLPPASRELGAWIRCRADLAAERAAQLEPDRIAAPEAGFDPRRYPSVERKRPASAPARVAPASGHGCGDIVLFASSTEADALAAGEADELYVTGHPPPVAPGGRVYVQVSDRVLGWRALARRQARPNGTRLTFNGPWRPCAVPMRCEQPASGVADGRIGRQRWAWRSWPRDAEG